MTRRIVTQVSHDITFPVARSEPHEVQVITGRVYAPPAYRSQRIERWWSCTCGRVGPGISDKSRSDDSILRGGRSHVTRAGKRAGL